MVKRTGRKAPLAPKGRGLAAAVASLSLVLVAPSTTASAVAGDVVINEIMNNPTAVPDAAGEWFELYNTTSDPIDLDGWTIRDDGIDLHVISNGQPLIIESYGFLVLGNNADPTTNGGVAVDYDYGDQWFLANTADEVILLDGALQEVDRVEYDGGVFFPDPSGASMALKSPTSDNSDGGNWCVSVTPFGAGDLGTPHYFNDCNGPVLPATIPEIQGEAHQSPLLPATVLTSGIVTVVRPSGFYLQDAAGDASDGTSDAIFVATEAPPDVVVGDGVQVIANVQEFYPGGYGSGDLSTTRLVDPVVVPLTSGNSLPAPVVIGSGGRIPPAMVIDDDAAGDVELPPATYDPDDDGIDFFESLEGMRAQVNDAVVIGTNGFGEITVLGDNGQNGGLLTPRGGLVVGPDDFNPERLIVDDELVPGSPAATVGDWFSGPLVAVVDYRFGRFLLLNPDPLPPLAPGGLFAESTGSAIEGSLGLASLDVDYLDPGDDLAKFDGLAQLIVNGLGAPHIICLQRVLDRSGTTDDGVTGAGQTYAALIGAISAAGGPTYEWRDIKPADNQDGGPPGGNNRVAFLYRPDSVVFVDRPGGNATAATVPVLGPDGVELTLSPGRIDPNNAVFSDNPKALAGEFTFAGRKLIVVNVHFNSPAGDDPLFGRVQPPVATTAPLRQAMAQVIHDFVESALMLAPDADVVVLGRINDHPFSLSAATLAGGVLTDLVAVLPEEDRYDFILDGNGMALDTIMVSSDILAADLEIDIVHANAEFAGTSPPTPRDPLVARVCFENGLWYPDADSDGHGAPSGSFTGCRPPGYVATADDCDDGDSTVHAGAPEINDGQDNQCPGDSGYGLVDELACEVGFDDEARIFWTPQDGATEYEIIRSENPWFSGSCVVTPTTTPPWEDPDVPAPGATAYYVVRASAPFVGSAGRASDGTERSLPCVGSSD